MDDNRKALVAIAAAALLAVTLLGWRALDRSGWVPHRLETAMYVGADPWPAGEFRKCASLPREDGTIFFLGCVAGRESFDNPQTVSVTYWGRIRRPDRFRAAVGDDLQAWQWRCRRKGDSVTCYAVN